jgi:excisionase family DNA binding protein
MTDTNTYSTRQAAEVLDLSQSTVQRMADEGTIPSYRTPGRIQAPRCRGRPGVQAHTDIEHGDTASAGLW